MAGYGDIRTGRHGVFVPHAHLVFVTRNLPPTTALSRLVNSLKGMSSRRMRQESPDLRRHYWRANRLWSGSYFAGSAGGPPISLLRQYIEQQDRPA
jgi:putative transposase